MAQRSKVDRAPRQYQSRAKTVKKGLILVNTGNGKGKSTAAFGTALRALGRGYRVAIVQFIKGTWSVGEVKFFKSLKGQCEVYTMGEGFTWDTKSFAKDVDAAQRAWQKCLDLLMDKDHWLVVFDEINYAIKYNFLDVEDVIRALKKKPLFKNVILTGDGAPEKLIEFADLVTDMRCVKHPYAQGIQALAGIDY